MKNYFLNLKIIKLFKLMKIKKQNLELMKKNLIHIHFYFFNYFLFNNKIIFYSYYTFKKFVKIPIWLF